LFHKLTSIVEINGKAVCAEPASPSHGFFSLFKDKSASGWLQRVGGMSREQAADTIRRLEVFLDDIRYLPGNSRLLLGMEAACAHRPDLLVFSTSGADWTGTQAAFAMARNHCAHGAVLFVSFPFISQERLQYRDFPGSERVVISDHGTIAA
jgi:hypothetical protein